MNMIVLDNEICISLGNGKLKLLYEEKPNWAERMDFPDGTCGCEDIENHCHDLRDYDDRGMDKGGWD